MEAGLAMVVLAGLATRSSPAGVRKSGGQYESRPQSQCASGSAGSGVLQDARADHIALQEGALRVGERGGSACFGVDLRRLRGPDAEPVLEQSAAIDARGAADLQ